MLYNKYRCILPTAHTLPARLLLPQLGKPDKRNEIPQAYNKTPYLYHL